jgi:hypothetical protein
MGEDITPRMRLALGAKAIFLNLLGVLFLTLTAAGLVGDGHHLLVRAAAVLGCTPISAFLFWCGWLGLHDAFTGKAVEIVGAEALASRRSGHSLRLPDGHFAEFVLFNPYAPLIAGRRYTVVIGRRSRVVVAPPREE